MMFSKIYLFLLAGSLFALSCGSDNKNTPAADESSAICIWDKVSITDKPSKSGKYLSSVSLGEKLDYLEEKKEEEQGKKTVTYCKVKLLDGKEGWIRADFIAIGATVIVITGKTDIYSRPDLSTITKKSYEPMDIVAIVATQDDWSQVKGKRKGGKWIETGWIKNKAISSDERDVAVALYVSRASAKPKKEDRLKELLVIRDNPDLQGSIFQAEISAQIDELSGATNGEEDHEDESEEPADTAAE